MEQTPIIKSDGTTESERYLVKLTEKSFLGLWSYPNVFVKNNPKKQAKELCDILVVCGDDILIFSDKTIGWPSHDDANIAWQRWYNKAVRDSVKQVKQATRKINNFPDGLFLDQRCTQKFPLKLPAKDKRRVHGIVVALGAKTSRRKHKGNGSSLFIEPSDNKKLFTIGDENPDGIFVHIFDDTSLDIVMKELDTISDFTEYLVKKEKFIRSGKLAFANGEEDLVAYYMWNLNESGEHDFVIPEEYKLEEKVAIEPGYHRNWISEPQYKAMKIENEKSYLWDAIIESFSQEILGSRLENIIGQDTAIDEHELGLRHLALVPRYLRRTYSKAFSDHLIKDVNGVRCIVSEDKGKTTGYLLLAYHYKREAHPSYIDYRKSRLLVLDTYAKSYLQRYSDLERIVGIAMEPQNNRNEMGGRSLDLIYAGQYLMNENELLEFREVQRKLNIFQEGNQVETRIQDHEYPKLSTIHNQPFEIIVGSNKKKIGRNEPCFCGSGKKYKKCCLR